MASGQSKNRTGDSAASPLRQTRASLERAANADDQAVTEPLARASPSKAVDTAVAILSAAPHRKPHATSCKQKLWFSFFFDGTGNNLAADRDTQKHSNVARLYRAHLGDENDGGIEKTSASDSLGIYRFYIPGIGTYFRAIGDDGGSAAGLGSGAYGTERIEWALATFNRKFAHHVALAKNPANAIIEVNISAFGFSRGAALARAFVREFVADLCQLDGGGKWRLKTYDAPIRIRFLGLFDTVASVGLAMSANNLEKPNVVFGGVESHIRARLRVHVQTRPDVLAFSLRGEPGADPAPGWYNGHADWGDNLNIPWMVEDVRHFVAGHEIRNSFPLDSISIINPKGVVEKPGHFHEYVYPGVHSDVGGSYRPGEGGKSEMPSTKLGLVSLNAMYQFAISAGVPLQALSALSPSVRDDFSMRPTLVSAFIHYMSKLGTQRNLGDAFKAHMKMFYAWRFRSIRMKRNGDSTEATRIMAYEKEFAAEGALLQKKSDLLQKDLNLAEGRKMAAIKALHNAAQSYQTGSGGEVVDKLRKNVEIATLEQSEKKAELLGVQATMQALPKTGELPAIIKLYDDQLMRDAQSIFDLLAASNRPAFKYRRVTDWSSLRPHYRVLIDAYVAEWINNAGLTDEGIINFFDEYVHDSLAGFAKDATLPSDPRVIYVGEDEKLRYAEKDRRASIGRRV